MNRPEKASIADASHGVAAIQRLAFGGIANPTQRAVLRGSDATYLTARQRELDAFEEQRQSYNTALQDFQTNVYEPYKAKSAAYNTAAEKYNTDVYNPYKTQFDAYTKAVEEYNAGPRTADYAGPAAPTLASEFTMTAPTSPTAFAKEAPVLPFEVTDVETHQKAAAKRAVQDASDRAVAIDVVSDPGRFNFGSMSVSNRFMAEGGEVEDDLKGKTARSIVKDFKDYGYSREEIEQMANEVATAGRGGDELLAYLSPESVRLLKANGGSGSINPITGLPEFKGGFLGGIVDKLSDAFSDLFGNKGQPAPAAPAPTPAAPVPVAPAPAPAPTGPTAAELAAQLEAANKKYADDMAAIREQQAAAQKLAIENALKADAEARAKAALPMSKVIAASSTGAVAKPTDPYTIPPSLKTVGAGPVIPSLDLKRKLDPSPPSRYFDRPVEDPNKSPYTPIVNRPGDTGPTAPYNPISQPLPYQTKGVGAIGSVGPASSFFDQPASDPNNFFATTPQTSTGLAPGTAAIGPADMPLYGAKNTMSALGANPNLSPGMLGGQQNAGYRTDRLGNRIYSPGAMPLYGFAKGGDIDLQALLAQNTETLSDDTPEEVINTDPLGTAQKMMADFSSVSQTNPNVSPVRKAIKQTKAAPAKSGSAKMAYKSLVKGDLGAMGTSPPKLQDTDSAQAQMRELARVYQLKAQASQDRARGLSANTFGAPTLGQPTLTKDKLTSKRFNKGGEAKKPEAEKTESSGFFSSIFKGNDENFIKDIKNKAEKNEDYRAMLEYLKSKDAVPDIKTGYLPESLDAVFSALKLPFAGAVGSGTIKLNKNNLVDSGYKGDIGPSTLAHEMAHATDRQFEEQNSKQSGIFSKGNKFTDAYEKMVGDGGMRSGKKRTELARKSYPEWFLQNKEYRALPYEMAAHGVGNFAGPTTAEAAPPHVDATAATEFQILLDLARRNSNPPVKRAGGSTEEGETSIKDQLIGAGETALTLGSGALSSVVGMPYGLYKGLTSGKYLEGKAPAIAEKEAQAFIERNTYVPRSTKGRENLEEINRLMEQSKLPPILPETAMLRSIPRAAVAAQGERIGMATEKALEKPVTEVLKRGGKSAEMLKALSAPPSYVSRAPGGYFPTSRANEGGILSNLDKAFDPILKEAKLVEDPEKREALSVLFNQKAKDFYTKQAGSIEDPLRKDILAGALKFERSTPMGDAFPQALLKGAAQGDLESLRLLEKNYDQMIGIRSVVPRRTGTPAVEGVVRSQIMTNIRDNLDKIPDAQLVAYSGRKPGQGLTLDKIPDAQLVAYSGRKPGQGPTAVADLATEIRQKVKDNPTLFSTIAVADLATEIRKKVKDNPTLFSTILEPRIAETLFNKSQNSTDVDIARFPSVYGTASTEAMVANPSALKPDYNDPMPPNYFLPELEMAIEKGQPIQDLGSSSIRLLGMTPENMLEQARQMPAQDLNRMGFADFLKKAYVSTQKVDAFKAALPKVKKLIQDGKPPPADIMTYGVEDFLPTTNNFRWVKVVKPEAVRAIAVGMNNSVAGYATSDTYGSLRKGRTALNSGEAEVYALYDKNNVPHVTIEYLTNKEGVPDGMKNTIAQLTGNGPLSVNALPKDYTPQIVDFMNNVKPSSIPRNIKNLLEDTGQKKALNEEVLSLVYFGVPIEALRGGDDNLLQQLGAVVDNPPRQPGAVVDNPPRQPGAADNNAPAVGLLRRLFPGVAPRPPRRRPFI